MLTIQETNLTFAMNLLLKFADIFEEEMQVDAPAMVLPLGEVATTEGISSIPLNHYSIDLDKYFFNASFECHHKLLLKL